MQIKLGDTIRELRKRDGRTQEELAEALGVTKQAVSRWEAGGGYPDIEILPAVANYFHITIDELFGYDNDRQAKIQWYIDQSDQRKDTVSGQEDSAQRVAFLREAISEFPSEWRLQLRLANALEAMGHEKSEQGIIVDRDGCTRYNTEYNAQNECWKEAVSLYEEVLKREIGDDTRRSVTESLIWLYSFMGDQENGERTMLSQSPVHFSREVLLAKVLKNEKTEEYRGDAILALMHELYMVLQSAVVANDLLSRSQAGIDTLLALTGLYERVFDCGDYSLYHNDLCLLYMDCSSIAIELDDSERAMRYFETALDHYLEFKKVKKIISFTAPLLRKVRYYAPSIILLDREWFEDHMQSFPAKCADAIRNNPKYASIFCIKD